MKWLYIGLSLVAVLALFGWGTYYSITRRSMRDRAAIWAGHPPGTGNDVYDETLLNGIKLELGRLTEKAGQLHAACDGRLQGVDISTLLDMSPLTKYLYAHLNDYARGVHEAEVEELCDHVCRLCGSAGTDVLTLHEGNMWARDVRQWRDVVWWLAPALGASTEAQTA